MKQIAAMICAACILATVHLPALAEVSVSGGQGASCIPLLSDVKRHWLDVKRVMLPSRGKLPERVADEHFFCVSAYYVRNALERRLSPGVDLRCYANPTSNGLGMCCDANLAACVQLREELFPELAQKRASRKKKKRRRTSHGSGHRQTAISGAPTTEASANCHVAAHRTMTGAEPEPAFEVHAGHGPHMLLVHGFLSSRAQWQPNLRALAEFCTPVVVELFGHGRSPSPVSASCYHPLHYVEAFETIRKALGCERWFVTGYSLGAGLTIRYALTHPDRVIGQAFTNSTSAFGTIEAASKFVRDEQATVEKFTREGRRAIEAIPVHPRHAKRLPADIKKALLLDCEQLDPLGVALTMCRTNGFASIRDRITENTVPGVLIAGIHEKRFLPHRDLVAEEMPNIDVKNVPAGHAVNIEAADEFNEALKVLVSRFS